MSKERVNMRDVMGPRVYIVTTGEYSDYRIHSVHTDIDVAKRVADENCGDVDVWGVDEETPSLPPGYAYYCVRMSINGDVISSGQSSDPYNYGRVNLWRGELLSDIAAKNEKHAVKIMNERRAMILSLPVQPVAGVYEWPSFDKSIMDGVDNESE